MSLLVSLALLAQSWCSDMRVTGYLRGAHSPWTFDGTSIFTDENIAAASWDIPLQSLVAVWGAGTYRVADRGSGLGSHGWIDIAVWTRDEAYSVTGVRRACVYPAGMAAEGATW